MIKLKQLEVEIMKSANYSKYPRIHLELFYNKTFAFIIKITSKLIIWTAWRSK